MEFLKVVKSILAEAVGPYYVNGSLVRTLDEENYGIACNEHQILACDKTGGVRRMSEAEFSSLSSCPSSVIYIAYISRKEYQLYQVPQDVYNRAHSVCGGPPRFSEAYGIESFIVFCFGNFEALNNVVQSVEWNAKTVEH